MEGRAIARPNANRLQNSDSQCTPFNGGPDNCPAERCGMGSRMSLPQGAFNGGPDNCPAELLQRTTLTGALKLYLQWRAGQLSGRTDRAIDHVLPSLVTDFPSMEGRTTVRPEPVSRRGLASPHHSGSLQWRAGQLPGRTARLIWGC